MAKPDAAQVLACLRKILESTEFTNAGRLKSFLAFVVHETLAGRGEQLKEYVIAIEVYRKEEDFDPRVDAAVRVGATKLRARLEKYYQGTGSTDPVIMSIPKGSYQAQLQMRLPPSLPFVRLPARRWFRIAALLAACALLAAISSAYRNLKSNPPGQTGFRRIQVTTEPGIESNPSFSPDGTHVAFAADLAEPGNSDIFIREVGSGNTLRLTSDPAPDSHPAWSPDGKTIAFIRNHGYGGAVYLVGATGGAERKLIHVNLAGLAWTADSQFIAALHRASQLELPSQLLIHVETARTLPLTSPADRLFDFHVAFSPDGERAALARCSSTSDCDIFVGDLQSNGTLTEPARRLTKLNRSMNGAAWSGDSKSILFSAGRYNDWQLLSVSAAGPAADPEPFFAGPGTPHYPSVPSRGPAGMNRIAIESSQRDENIWIAPLPSGDHTRDAPRPRLLAVSPRGEWTPELSPDGHQMAFSSDRSGSQQIWISGADGGNPRQLTSFSDSAVLFPRWSPSRNEIAFACFSTSVAGEDRAIYTIRTDGSGLLRVSPSRLQATEPAWSENGNYIYYGAPSSGWYQLWKSSRLGGPPVQITRFGGYRAFESHSFIYYTLTGDAVWRAALDGTGERKVLPEAHNAAWYPVHDGILFVTRSRPGPNAPPPSLAHWNSSTGVIRNLGALPHPDIARFTVGPGESSILYSRTDQSSVDIVILENYRKLAPR